MDEKNLKGLYSTLKKEGYNPPEYDAFMNDMQDEKNLQGVYNTLKKEGYTPPEYNVFRQDIFGSTQQNPVVGTPSVVQQVIGEYDASVANMPAVSPQRRPSLREQVDNPQFPAMEELPWMNVKDRNEASHYTDALGKRVTATFKEGGFEPFSHREEDARVNEQYTPKKVANESDIIENARNRFALTERGGALNNELSNLQKEKADKYFDEFRKSKEYQEIASRQARTPEEVAASNKAINDLFTQHYGKAIDEDMQPYYDVYRDEVFSRYGIDIKGDLTKLGKKNTTNQVADLTEEVNVMLDKQHESLKQHGGSGSNAMNALMGSTHYNQATGEQRREIGTLESARRLLENSQEIINEAGKKGSTNFVEGLGRGLRDNFDADKWTMGLTEMADAKYLNNALEKSERGEPLTPVEEKLLKASTINMVTQAYFGSDLGRGYKAGQVTAESLPFMMEFIANPISGSGNAIAKGLLKYGLKKFGSVAASKSAKIAGRLIGDSAAALGMEGTTGIGHVAAGTLDRLNQNYETSLDDNGEVHVDKVKSMGIGEAFARSGASKFFENQSEMIFNAFRGGSKIAKETVASVAPGMSGKTANKVIEFYDKIRNNKTIQSVADRAQFHGILEEYGEEVYNNIANASIGEMNVEDVVDIDNNIDTFLGLAPTSLAFAALGVGGLVYENAEAKNRLRKFVGELDEDSKTLFEELWSEIEKGNNDIAKAFVKKTLDHKSLTTEQKKAFVFSVKDMINARDTEQEVNGADDTEDVTATVEEATPTPIDKVNVYRNFKRAERKVNSLVPAEILPQLDGVMDVEQFAHDNNLNDNQAMAVSDYLSAKQPYMEYQNDTFKRREEAKLLAKETATAKLNEKVNKETGFVIQAKMFGNDNPVYLTGGRLVFGDDGILDKEKSTESVFYYDESQNKPIHASPDKFDALISINSPEEIITQAEIDADNNFVASEEESLQSPAIPDPRKGDATTINIEGATYAVEVNPDNPSEEFLLSKLNADGELDIEHKNGNVSYPISIDEYYKLKEEELWKDAPIDAQGTGNIAGKKILPDGRLAVQTAGNDSEVTFDIIDRNGNVVDSDVMSITDFSVLNDYLPETEETTMTNSPASEIQQAAMEGTSDAAQSINVSENVPINENVPVVEESKVSEELLPTEEAPVIPSDDKGNVLYHKVPVDVTIDALNREELEPDEIDSFVDANKNASRKLLSSLESKAPKMGTSIAKYKADKKEWNEKLSDAKAQMEYWDSVGEEVAASRVQPGDKTAEAILSMGEPMTGEELAATMLGTGRLPVLYDSYKKETGGRNAEARGMVGLFASKANGGMTIEEAGEQLMLADQENGTNFFDQTDPNAGRNAILDVLSGARTRGDLFWYIKSNREAMAERERQAEYDAYSSWTEDNFGMTPEDYEAYEEQVPSSISERFKEFDEEDFYNNIVNELYGEQGEIAGATESSEVLQGEGIVSPERTETSENEGGTVSAGTESSGEEGTVPEETSVINQNLGGKENEKMEAPVGQSNIEEKERDKKEQRNIIQGEIYVGEDAVKEERNLLSSTMDTVRLHGLPDGNEFTERAESRGEKSVLPTDKYRPSNSEFFNTGDSKGYNERPGEQRGDSTKESEWSPVGEVERVSDIGGDIEQLEGVRRETSRDGEDGRVHSMDGRVYSKEESAVLNGKELDHEQVNTEVIDENYNNSHSATLTTGTSFGNKQEKKNFVAPIPSKGEDVLSYAGRIAEAKNLFDAGQDAGEQIAIPESSMSKEEEANLIAKGDGVIDGVQETINNIAEEREKINISPTDAQKEAGNYKKGHVTVDGYNISIENPKGGERSGVDANGSPWSVTMNNDYGYIRGTKGVDGDHIDVFLSDFPSQGSVFVVDQVNEDGLFDEHKIMYGFSSADEAKAAYLANYSPGWNGLGNITEVSKDEFKKWIDSSHRKTKPFSEYKDVKRESMQNDDIRFREVYHGSPHDFDRFDHSYMGTGEGAQAYGWGTYVTEVDGIARSYAENITSRGQSQRINKLAGSIQAKKDFIKVRKNDIKKNENYDKYVKIIKKNLFASQKEYEKAERAGNEKDMRFYKELIDISEQQLSIEHHKHLIENFWDDINNAQDDIDAMNNEIVELNRQIEELKGKRNLYTVEIPGDGFLRWEEDAGEEVAGKVANRLNDMGFTELPMLNEGEHRFGRVVKGKNKKAKIRPDMPIKDLYYELSYFLDEDVDGLTTNGDKDASLFLNSIGFNGIEYPAQATSGGRADNAKNYVIFDDKNLEINEHTHFRDDISFNDGEILSITESEADIWSGEKSELHVEGLNGGFTNKQRMLDEFRAKYPNYLAELTEDENGIKVSSWRNILKDVKRTPKEEKRQADYIERKTSRALRAIDGMAKKLGLEVDVITSTDGLQGRKAHAKGWFEVRSGKVVLVLPNHVDGTDIMRTILHEGVAHYGLRKLLGEHFDDFLDNVYSNVSSDVRTRIDTLMDKKGLDARVATEEYLAGLAEDTDFENASKQGWWSRIKELFVKMLSEVGINLDFRITDNELRYLLWRSYENLTNPGSRRSILGEAANIARQYEMKVGNYQESIDNNDKVVAEGVARDGNAKESGNGELERVKSDVERVLSKYGKKEYRMFDKDVTSTDLEELLPYLEDGNTLQDVADYLNKPETLAVYVRGIDKIYIFANKMSGFDEKRIEKIFFHENIHASLNDIYGDTGRRTVVNLFYDKVDNSLNKYKEKVKEIYDELSFKEEFFTWRLHEAMGSGDFSEFTSVLDEYGVSTIDKILKNIGYDREKEEDERHGRGRILGNVPGERSQGKGALQQDNNQGFKDAGSADGSGRKGEEEVVLFRDATDEEPYSVAQKVYDNAVKESFRNNFSEGWFDFLRSVEKLQEAIAQETGKAIQGFENVYQRSIQLSSLNKAEFTVLQDKMMDPLSGHIAHVIRGKVFRGHKMTYDDVDMYLNCKHGLERNEMFAHRDAKDDKGVEDKEAYLKNRERDYSGLTGIFDTEKSGLSNNDLEAEAEKYIKEFESTYDAEVINKLWNSVGELTGYALDKSYKCGLIGKKEYEETKNSFKYYVPLRGFSETTSGDVYDYISRYGNENAPQKVLKKADGRSSRADNILATMMNMAHSSVIQGNKNAVKQSLMAMALNHRTPLLSISKQWYEKGADGLDKPLYPVLSDKMSADEQRKAIEDFEEEMKIKHDAGDVFERKDGLTLQFRVAEKWEADNHCVRVLRGGKEYLIWVNGNPKAAQALNGDLNLDSSLNAYEDKIAAANRFLARMQTAYSPEFIVRNLQRDILFSNLTAYIKEGRKYQKKFNRNLKDNLSFIAVKGKRKGTYAGIYSLYTKFQKGTLDMSIPRERYFKEFVENGGETGYSLLYTVDDYKKRIDKIVKQANTGYGKVGKGIEAIGAGIEFSNKGVENACRFAAYMTSRESGRGVMQSVMDAKEISVNFNRKGSGALGNRFARMAYTYMNPAIQAIYQMLKLSGKYPTRSLVAFGSVAALGFLASFATRALLAAFGADDDDDKYDRLSPWKRRNNICIFMGDGFATWQLPPELRVFYGIGEIGASMMTGDMNHENAFLALMGQLQQLSPWTFVGENNIGGVDFLKTTVKSAVPTSISFFTDAYLANEDFLGRKITNAESWNKMDPDWKRCTKGTNTWLIAASRWLNEATGGNDHKRGWLENGTAGVLNPGAIEYLFTSYLGGLGTFAAKLSKVGMAIGGDEDMNEFRNIPIASTLYTSVDNDYSKRRIINDAFRYYESEFDVTDNQVKGFNKDWVLGNEERAAQAIDNLHKGNDYKRWVVLKDYLPVIKKLKKEMYEAQNSGDKKERDRIEEEIYQKKKEAIGKLVDKSL